MLIAVYISQLVIRLTGVIRKSFIEDVQKRGSLRELLFFGTALSEKCEIEAHSFLLHYCFVTHKYLRSWCARQIEN